MEFSVTSEGMSTGEEYLKLFKTIIEYFMTLPNGQDRREQR